jgi:hypothetical protein
MGIIPIKKQPYKSMFLRASALSLAVVLWPQSCIQKTSQLTRPRGVFQFPQGFGLDLADTLSGDRELLAHFL